MTIAMLNTHAAVSDNLKSIEATKSMISSRTSTKFIVESLLALGVIIATSSPSHAANCENFHIRLHNHTNFPVEIKITKFEYWDEDKWKTENVFGPIGYKRLDYWYNVEYERNLQGIGSEYTYFRVTFKKDIDM